jgi:hypothetical protein
MKTAIWKGKKGELEKGIQKGFEIDQLSAQVIII